jgi:hypothetical protein
LVFQGKVSGFYSNVNANQNPLGCRYVVVLAGKLLTQCNIFPRLESSANFAPDTRNGLEFMVYGY